MKKVFGAPFVFLFFLMVIAVPRSYGDVETAHFSAHDLTKRLSNAHVLKLTNSAEEGLKKILDFYSVEMRVETLGKIKLEFDDPRKGTYSTVFLMKSEGGRNVRVVRVFGTDGEPQMLVHKLTHAVFPNPDKLIRNMMGIPMEVRFGNPLTFPMCGFSFDEWVLAMRQNKSYIPLEKFGREHEDWGMTTKGGVPVVLDKAKQHTMYAASGSFGSYLLNTYGVDKVKAFNRLSSGAKRPWNEVFGVSLAQLEAQWLQAIDSAQKADSKNLPILLKFLKKDPDNACGAAQELGAKKKR